MLCGDIAALACWLTTGEKDGALGTILTLKADDPWRGIVVGASVLVLIRSKLLNIKDSPAGGDYVYTLGATLRSRTSTANGASCARRFKTGTLPPRWPIRSSRRRSLR
ncbi:MAG: hypothetical protein WDN04_00525 [Rhodospirillales bacterium]